MKITIEVPVETYSAFIETLPVWGAHVVADKPKVSRKQKTVDLWEPVIVRKNGNLVREIDGVTAKKLANKVHNPMKLDQPVRNFDCKDWGSMAAYYDKTYCGVTRNDDGQWSSKQSTKDYIKNWCDMNHLVED